MNDCKVKLSVFLLVAVTVALFAPGCSFGPSVGDLASDLKSQDYLVRWDAAKALGETKDADAVGPLVDALGDKEDAVAFAAVDSLAKIGGAAVSRLTKRLRDSSVQVRQLAALSLGSIGDSAPVGALSSVLKSDKVADVRLDAAIALGKIGIKHALAAKPASVALNAAKNDANADVKKAVANALAGIAEAETDRANKAKAKKEEQDRRRKARDKAEQKRKLAAKAKTDADAARKKKADEERDRKRKAELEKRRAN